MDSHLLPDNSQSLVVTLADGQMDTLTRVHTPSMESEYMTDYTTTLRATNVSVWMTLQIKSKVNFSKKVALKVTVNWENLSVSQSFRLNSITIMIWGCMISV